MGQLLETHLPSLLKTRQVAVVLSFYPYFCLYLAKDVHRCSRWFSAGMLSTKRGVITLRVLEQSGERTHILDSVVKHLNQGQELLYWLPINKGQRIYLFKPQRMESPITSSQKVNIEFMRSLGALEENSMEEMNLFLSFSERSHFVLPWCHIKMRKRTTTL